MSEVNDSNNENPAPEPESETEIGLSVESGSVPDTVAAAIVLYELRAAGAEAITAAGRRSVTARVPGTPNADAIRARLGNGFTVDSSEGRLSISW